MCIIITNIADSYAELNWNIHCENKIFYFKWLYRICGPVVLRLCNCPYDIFGSSIEALANQLLERSCCRAPYWLSIRIKDSAVVEALDKSGRIEF